ncbi:hypothetical protein [Nostoc mirabile]|uniref:hypothetical protein n=1 Tax=Nostoc mirabile TaxID=2907820 RepID=UPI001E412571|nr:hypothetical protein [Nostoc mirabile]
MQSPDRTEKRLLALQGLIGGSASAWAIAVLTRRDRFINLSKQNSAIRSQEPEYNSCIPTEKADE